MDFSIRGTQVFRTAAPGAATDHFGLAPWRWGPHGTLVRGQGLSSHIGRLGAAVSGD